MTGTNDTLLAARILIVDDKEPNIRLLERLLSQAGYTSVRSTTDPTEVCELHRANRFDLILLDLQMPVMDGFEVMEGLKAIEGNGYLPVIAITAQPAHKLRALDAGAKDFISKPFDLVELRARVRNILEVRLYSNELSGTIKVLEEMREALRIKTLEEQRLRDRELNLAQQTQESLLPAALPACENFAFEAYSQPTRYVGGDFYDFLQLESGQWTGILADVSGKGIPAALLSSMTLGALSSEFRSGVASHEALARVNRLIRERSMPSQFVTLFQFLLNPDGAGEFISAGHNAVYLHRTATGRIEQLESDSHFLGMFDFATWQSRPFHLNTGDTLIVYSDGLTDAENPSGETFGEQRLQDVIRRHASGTALKEGILTALAAFTEGAPQNDDITFLLVRKSN